MAGLAVLALAACATPGTVDGTPANAQQRALYEAHAAAVRAIEQWALDGKLAISDGEDGGSGKLEWRTGPDLVELDFRGALGRGAWQLEIRPGLAVLSLANGDTWEAREVSTLVHNQVGWRVPVDALGWWVRGLAAPGAVESQYFDDAGRMVRLSQQGWEVEYKRYGQFSGVTMPTRLEARSGERHVRLVMRDWTFSRSGENGS